MEEIDSMIANKRPRIYRQVDLAVLKALNLALKRDGLSMFSPGFISKARLVDFTGDLDEETWLKRNDELDECLIHDCYTIADEVCIRSELWDFTSDGKNPNVYLFYRLGETGEVGYAWNPVTGVSKFEPAL